MEEQLITFETAKLAKEKGFYSETKELYFYNENRIDKTPIIIPNVFRNKDIHKENNYCRPAQSILKTWLRKEHNIECEVHAGVYDGKRMYYTELWQGNKDTFPEIELPVLYEGKYGGGTFCYDYEQTLELCLQAGLKLL